MADPIITLTTDFGEDSPYVAAMKGVLVGINPAARLVDLSHQLPPQDLRYAAFFLATAIPYFPAEVIHVIVVDPGVGTERALLYVEVGGHRLLVPDNGCWTTLVRDEAPRVLRLSESRYWRLPVSATFHGRDILAPVAALLSLGLEASSLGPAVSDWMRIELPQPTREANSMRGEVLFVDHFGNLITNIPATALPSPPQSLHVKVGDVEISQRVRCYGEAQPGELVALVSSTRLLEIAVNQGNAARQLGARVGAPVSVTSSGTQGSIS